MDCPNDEQLAEALRHCETEPIARLGRIQSHGALVAVDNDPPRTIRHVSANIGTFFDAEPESLLGQPLERLIGADQVAEVAPLLHASPAEVAASRLIYSVPRDEIIELQATIHGFDAGYLIELEPTHTRIDDMSAKFRQVRDGFLQLDLAEDAAAYLQDVAALVRGLIGFDRVMVYRFDANWEGEVVAESRADAAASYLGNRFPAGDIPPQARELYTRNPLRLVADIECDTVPLIPATDPRTGMPLDLTHSILRAFSPVHLEYLRNMGVRASASISILLDGRLWGLIACHHGEAAHIAPPVRELLEFVGKVVSLKLTGLEARRLVDQTRRLSDVLAAVSADLFGAGKGIAAVHRHAAEITGMIHASGALLVCNGVRHRLGEVPGEEQIDDLLAWLSTRPEGEILATNHLSSLMPAAAAFAGIGAGCLAIPVGGGLRDAMVWFRREKLQQVRWAGRPEKTLSQDDLGQARISPRKSFAAWTETWRNRSAEWAPEDITAATVLARLVCFSARLPAEAPPAPASHS